MKQPTVLGVSLCLGIFTATISMAHSEKAINEAFPRGPIPLELIEATRELESTAGMNSLRGEAHAKQHRLLEQYLKAGLQRTCDESRAALLGLDEAILVARNSADGDEELKLRHKRDEASLLITESCAADTPPLPAQP